MSLDNISKRCDLVISGVFDEGVQWPGGDGTFMATGTIASGGVALQADVGGVWVPAVNWAQEACVLAAAGCMNFTLPRCRIRANGGGTASGLNVLAVGN
jgi:hypothetical protein